MIPAMSLAPFYALAALCLILTLLPFSRHEAWWVRAADFPRLQIAVVAAVALIGLLWLSKGGTLPAAIAASLGLAILYHVAAILPYTMLWTTDMKAAASDADGASISVMVANVLMSNRETERLFAMIDQHDPDVLLAVETDDWWCRRIGEKLADRPYAISHPLDNTYGMFLASRLEMADAEVRFLLKDDIPSIRADVRLDNGAAVTLYALHPEPPSPTEAETSLPRDAELVTVAKEIAERGRQAIVMGDLNDVAWSRTSRLFRRIGRMLDPRIGRGLFSTFHAHYWPLRWPLDHVFASDDFLLEKIERLGAFGSDHFPILVTLRLAPEAARPQTAEAPDQADVEEAEDKLERSQSGLRAMTGTMTGARTAGA